jgi:hypothetical protein
MKLSLAVITLFLVGCSSVSTDAGTDVNITGTWNGMWRYSHFAYEERFIFKLTQQDREIVGTGVDEKGIEAEIVGRIKKSNVDLTVRPADGSHPITFEGKIENNGNYMRGKFSVGNTVGVWFARKERTHDTSLHPTPQTARRG